MKTWASVHHGFLGRAPDYMNTAILAYASAAGVLEEEYPAYASNLKRYQEYCRENDITLSHVFIQPKAARMSTFLRTFKEPEAARVMDKNKDGIVVRGRFYWIHREQLQMKYSYIQLLSLGLKRKTILIHSYLRFLAT